MTEAIYTFFTTFFKPFTSAFYLISIVLLLAIVFNKTNKKSIRLLVLVGFSIVFAALYTFVDSTKGGEMWLERLESPIFTVITLLVIPAIFLRKYKWYKYLLIIPAIFIGLAVFDVIRHYVTAPENIGFSWFLIRPSFLLPAIVSFLLLVQYFTDVNIFRKVTRITMLILLVYGGFIFRQDYVDYAEALAKRANVNADFLTLTETTPVLKYDNKLAYVPSAPCRFSSDGGYVQGCVMELLQRTMQINFSKVFSGDPSEIAVFAMAVGAILSSVILLYIGARWWCGWVCPLSTIGDGLDFIRRKMGLPHFKPARTVKLAHFYSGFSLAGFTLLLARLYPGIDENGKFMGCKIPLYPFCKICPAQQVCPVVSKGIGAYPALPGMEWLFGFFRISVIVLLGVFLVGFMSARRIWCRFCPMGMIAGIFNKGGMVALKKESTKCNGCGVCNEVCPMDIHYVRQEMEKEDVSNFDCIYCLKCVDKCPQDKCLTFEFAGQKVMESKFDGK